MAKLAPVYPGLRGDDVGLLERTFGHSRFVFLRRDDVLAQAVSWLRAEQTGRWFVGGNGEISGDARWWERAPLRPRRHPGFVATIREHNAAWEAWFAACGIRPHRVRYEDLDRDMTQTVRDILGHLGLDVPAGGVPVVARHRRQADDLNARWIARYRAGCDT
ncbi:Stf0 family sulfotransferase [Micromonospora endolithica]|uniref:Stf0 family sulfotransferase n=1 Tax=Micromonospora endolithica TaxID=230091 RepID=UPI0011ABD32E|nr:Stf0 family sulfotransferase [Micromonospora endolithica]TWJ19916.1 Stf0 sulfotransferase [Micromonospora endolithica]